MNNATQRIQEYLRKAKEAEDHAAEVLAEPSKSAWLRIAAGYHDLAAEAERSGSPLEPEKQ